MVISSNTNKDSSLYDLKDHKKEFKIGKLHFVLEVTQTLHVVDKSGHYNYAIYLIESDDKKHLLNAGNSEDGGVPMEILNSTLDNIISRFEGNFNKSGIRLV